MTIWSGHGFEPWEYQSGGVSMGGVSRKITMVKSSILGPIAKYYAWDYVVWSYGNAAETAEHLQRRWKPMADVVTQRFVLVGAGPRRIVKSFWLGLMGFLEIYAYTPGGAHHPKINDLIPLLNRSGALPQAPHIKTNGSKGAKKCYLFLS